MRAAGFLMLAACSFSARLDEPVPNNEAGVVTDDAPAATDAPKPDAKQPDAQEMLCALSDCVMEGGICQPDNSCLIDKSDTNVTCPAGVPCTVICDGDNACKDSVDCTMATSCNVTCAANNACEAGVACGATPCEVTCDGRGGGSNICKGVITSTDPTPCEVHCCGNSSNLCDSGASAHCTTDTVCP